MSGTIVTSAIISGGTVYDTSIPSGGFEVVLAGTLDNATLAAGGTLLALPGVTLNGLDDQGGAVISGGILTLATSATSPGTLAVDVISYSPGPVSVDGLNIDGTQLAFETLISLPDTIPTYKTLGVEPVTYIGNGGAAATVNSDGLLVVADGGQVSNVNDYAIVSAVTIDNFTPAINEGSIVIAQINDYNTFLEPTGGVITISQGGFASGLDISAGILNVDSGGIATGITAGGFVYQWVDFEGSDAYDATNPVHSNNVSTDLIGQVNVGAGAVISGAMINSLGAAAIAGSAIATVVNSGGAITVLAGGVTSGTQINGGYDAESYESVYGTASGTALTNDATERVFAGGTAIGTVDGNSSEIDVRGGTIISAQLGLGQIYVSSGGIATGTDILSYGVQYVYSGGLAISTNIGSGAEQVDGGVASGGYVGFGGAETVNSGGVTYDETISGSYADETLYTGSAISTQVFGGAKLNLYAGLDLDTVVHSGGLENIIGGTDGTTPGVASASVVLYGGVLAVDGRAGVISAAKLSAGGFIAATASGTVVSTTIGSGAAAYFATGAEGKNLNLTSGGTIIINNSAGASYLSAVTVQQGGVLEFVDSTQFADVSGTILAGGILAVGGAVISGATTYASPLAAPLVSGGLTLQTGAVLGFNDAVIESGGVLDVTSGARVFNTDNEYGGTLAIDSGAAAINISINRDLIIDNGLLEFTPLADSGDNFVHSDANNLDGTLTGTGSLVVTGNYTLYEQGSNNITGGTSIGTNATVDVEFAPSAGTGGFTLGQNAELEIGYERNNSIFNNVVQGLTPGDRILFDGVGNAGTPYLTLSGDVLTVSDGSLTESVVLGASSLDNNFTILQQSPGAVVTVEPLQVTGSFTIGAGNIATDPTIATGGTLELGMGGTVNGNISFAGTGARLIIDGPVPGNTITGFLPGDSIKLANVPFNPGDTVEVLTPGVVTIDENGTIYDLNIAGAFVGETGFSISGDLLLTEDALCYRRGTRILTPTGEAAIETLQIGDPVVTRFSGIQRIKWIGRQDYAARFVAANPAKIPVRIAAGALAPAMPARALEVSPGHALLLGDALVLAGMLINGVTITQPVPEDEVNYYQIELAAHDCIIAEGLWAETYADAPGMRAQFHNAAEYEAAYPDEPPAEALTLCAKRPEAGRLLEAALREPAARAAALTSAGRLEGFIDAATAWRIEGWAIDQAHPRLPVLLRVMVGRECLGETLACHYREDLAAAEKGSGRCAFIFTPPRRLGGEDLARLRVIRVGAEAEIYPAQKAESQSSAGAKATG